MSRGAKRGSGTGAAATAAVESSSSSSRGGGGWTNNLRSLLFSPSPTKSPRRKSRSKSTTPPPKNKRLSRSARCSNNDNTKDEPLAVLGAHPNYSLSLSKSSSSTSSSRSVGGGGSKKKTEASVRFRSFSTTSNNNHTSGKSLLCQSINRSPNYKFGPPAPSRDSENAQTVDKRQSLPVLSSLQQRPGGADTLTKKKMDSSSNSSVGSSNKYLYGGGAEKRRSFGEEIDGNHMVFDTSLLAVSMDSSTKDTTTAYNTSSSLSTGGGGGRGSNGGGGMMSVSFSVGDEDHTTVASSSDGGGAMTDASSSVAALRGWLGDFSKQQKKHYEEKSKAPTPDPAVKAPTRPRVGPPKHNTKEVSVPEQPYVPAPSTTTLSSSTPAPAPPAVATPSVTKPGSLSHHNLHHMPNSHHHHHHPPASTLAKRLVDTGLSARSRTTPIRFKPKFQEDDVKATNEGYKSVAKLSAWLADDPTKPKKVRQIRRGANVIAKSKTFDKGLADVIVETHNIPTGHVREKKHLLETSICTHNDDDDEEEEAHGLWAGDPLPSSSVPHTPSTNTHHNSYYHRRQPQSTTRRGDHLETSSAINVNDKKAWLQNAFKKSDVESTSGRHSAAAAAATPGLRPKAKTDVITAQDQRDDVTARAKHLWRNRSTTATTTTTAATSSRQGVTFAPTEKSSNSSNGPVSMVSRLQSRGNRGEPTDMFRKQTSPTLNDNDVSMISLNTTNQNDESMISLETSYIEEDSTDFSAARSLIVERAKQNGCSDVAVMTKVKLRQQKFEKLQKDARRSSLPHGQLKPSWQSGGNGDDDDTRDHQDASLSPSRCYVKKYIDNAPPKKTLSDLP